MATLVVFHAHPDDEAISTGGTMARAADEGHRVVLVVATGGEHGEVPDDLAPGETLADRRRAETERSAAVLGVDRIVWLGFRDSGMTGWEQNDDPACFARADVDVAAATLAEVLRAESADVLTAYDWHGVYGHPDHVQVHRVGAAAAAMVDGVRFMQATANRDEIVRQLAEIPDADFDPSGPADDGNPFGEPESALTLRVDVSAYVDRKRAAVTAHRSQVTDTSMFAEMPDEMFAAAFGMEWFIEADRQPPWRDGWIF